MLAVLVNHIQNLPPGATFNFRSICISCFGCPMCNWYLASNIQRLALSSNRYIIISSTKSGANIYRKL